MKNKLFIVGAVIALLLTAYFVGRCSTKAARDLATDNLIAARDSVHSLVVTINGLSTQVFEQKAMILTQKEALAVSELEKETLKKLHLKDVITNSELTGEIKILRDSLAIVPGTTIITVKDTAGLAHDYVRIPFTLLHVQEKYLQLDAGMNVNRTAYFDLHTPFTGKIIVGHKKDGLFKTVPVGIFTTPNPYITISNMDVVIVQENKPWYDHWWLHMIVGGAAFEVTRRLLFK
jgi:hypothetical protein